MPAARVLQLTRSAQDFKGRIAAQTIGSGVGKMIVVVGER